MAKPKQKSIAETDQQAWNERFLKVLNAGYKERDETIKEILADESLWRTVGGSIRQYVDKGFTAKVYRDKKLRGREHEELLRTAIPGLNAAASLLSQKGNSMQALELTSLAIGFTTELSRVKKAFATKRHGRDRVHAILYICRRLLEAHLERPVTFVTLANLVNAGCAVEVDSSDPTTEEQIRKNFASLQKNSPLICAQIDDMDLASF